MIIFDSVDQYFRRHFRRKFFCISYSERRFTIAYEGAILWRLGSAVTTTRTSASLTERRGRTDNSDEILIASAILLRDPPLLRICRQ